MKTTAACVKTALLTTAPSCAVLPITCSNRGLPVQAVSSPSAHRAGEDNHYLLKVLAALFA